MTDFSIIVATYQRTAPLHRLLTSLCNQTFKQFEVIIVDQNTDNRLNSILHEYADKIKIQHIHSERGVSRARNAGIAHAANSILCFADDDCWYPNDLLERLAISLQDPGIDGLSFPAVDEDGRYVARFDSTSGLVNKHNVWTRCCGITICVRANAARMTTGFDVNLGPGANTPFGAYEDTDFPLQVIANGGRILYDTTLFAYHPHPETKNMAEQLTRAKQYAPGLGYVCHKHRLPLWFFAYHVLRPLAGCIIAIALLKPDIARIRWVTFYGRLWGWVHFQQNP